MLWCLCYNNYMIIDHTSKSYLERWNALGDNRFNGAYYYSKEIVENIIPRVKTDRNWITLNTYGDGLDHSIVFIHNNINQDVYNWLLDYHDLILVCCLPETCKKVEWIDKSIYLPLSVDVDYVKQFKRKKTEDSAYVGRLMKFKNIELKENVKMLTGMPREELLPEMAKFKKVYCWGRCAIEAKILGCEVLPCNPAFPDPNFWKILDSTDAAKILQKKINEIDGVI